MRSRRVVSRLVAVGLAVGFVAGMGPSASAAGFVAPVRDHTAAGAARLVDRVPAPALNWTGCGGFTPGAQCATATLPLDYDHPGGAQTKVALLRVKATDLAHRIGTLFVNPGGPAGSGVLFAAKAPAFLGPQVLARFDVVGFDPRGTGNSDDVQCWPSGAGRDGALAGRSVPFPATAAQNSAYIAAAQAFGRACSSTGRPLSSAMSSVEVARDLDVLRRAVGDRRLTYFGISYGSYLGQVYANLFPDRVRALAIDGILDPRAMAGTPGTGSIPWTIREKGPQATERALRELLRRCRLAGASRCSLAATGDPDTTYDTIIATLKRTPLTVTDPATGATSTVTYPLAIAGVANLLSTTEGVAALPDVMTWTHTLQNPATPAPQRAAAAAALIPVLTRLQAPPPTPPPGTGPWPTRSYDNTLDARFSVTCADGAHPADASRWPAYAAAADAQVPGYGPYSAWEDAPCASATWTATDPHAYRGPFTRSTASPVLVIGNYWDPSTSYDNAVSVSRLLPNSRLVSVDSWGHTAFSRSTCLDAILQSYLVTQATPARGAHCTGTFQPFAN
jgi:pimeloyl-ACP methyl ester carboxylesterase